MGCKQLHGPRSCERLQCTMVNVVDVVIFPKLKAHVSFGILAGVNKQCLSIERYAESSHKYLGLLPYVSLAAPYNGPSEGLTLNPKS